MVDKLLAQGSKKLQPWQLCQGSVANAVPKVGCVKVSAFPPALLLQEGGSKEVPCSSGRVDIVTSEEVIEVKEISKWKQAIGQVLVYKTCFPKHKAQIHLFTTGDLVPLEQVRVIEGIELM